MTTVDWIALAFVAAMALLGFRRGLISGALSATGVVVGAVVGARLAPELLSGGSRSPYTPLVGLAGAAVLAILLESVGGVLGTAARERLGFRPLRTIDSLGGFVLGGATALAIVWVLGVVALQVPGQRELRREAQSSLLVRRLNEAFPPDRLLNALARIDPFPAIAGPAAPVSPPDPRLVRDPAVRQALQSVVRVVGTACGLGVAGSGWIAGRGLVVTAAHVVAGQDETTVQPHGSAQSFDAEPVAFDARNDVAVLRAPGLERRALPLVDATPGTPVAILGYPGNASLSVTPGRIGQTSTVLSLDARGDRRVVRTLTTLRGRVRQGNSGGPAVDAAGRVQTTVFAARVGATSGYGVPTGAVRRVLKAAGGPVSTGDCAR